MTTRIAWNKGIPMNPETKAKISAKMKGRPAWNKGTTMAEWAKKELSEKLKGRTAWNKGKPWPPEVIEKIRQARRKQA